MFKDEPVFDGQFSNACYADRMQEAFVHFQKNKKTDLTEYYNLIYEYKMDCFMGWILYSFIEKKFYR